MVDKRVQLHVTMPTQNFVGNATRSAWHCCRLNTEGFMAACMVHAQLAETSYRVVYTYMQLNAPKAEQTVSSKYNHGVQDT